jgi:hypothetical protein
MSHYWPVVSIREKLTELSHLLYTVTLYHPNIPHLPSAVVDKIAFALTSSCKRVEFFFFGLPYLAVTVQTDLFLRARVCWPLQCRPSFGIFERCLDSNSESCRRKQARYLPSHPSPCNLTSLSLFKAKNLMRKRN